MFIFHKTKRKYKKNVQLHQIKFKLTLFILANLNNNIKKNNIFYDDDDDFFSPKLVCYLNTNQLKHTC